MLAGRRIDLLSALLQHATRLRFVAQPPTHPFSAASSIAARKQLAKADVVLVYGSPATAAAAALLAHRLAARPMCCSCRMCGRTRCLPVGFFARFGAQRCKPFPFAICCGCLPFNQLCCGDLPGMRDLLVARGGSPHAPATSITGDYRSEERDHVTVPTDTRAIRSFSCTRATSEGPEPSCSDWGGRRCGPGSATIIIGSGPRSRKSVAGSPTGNQQRARDHVSPDALNLRSGRTCTSCRWPTSRYSVLAEQVAVLMASRCAILAFAPGEASELVARSGAGINDP